MGPGGGHIRSARLIFILLASLVIIGGALRAVNLGSRGYFVPDEDISFKAGNYFVLGNATGYGLKYVNGTLDLLWPHPYNFEHPPLGKSRIGYSGLVFGHTPLGYRMLGALLGTALVLLVFLVARRFLGGVWALAPAAVAAIDPLLVQLSRVATPDIYFLFFAVAAIAALLQLEGRPGAVAAGVLVGLSIASKWLGLYALLAILLYEVFGGGSVLKRVANAVTTIALAAGVYVASYLQYFSGGPIYQIGAGPTYLLLGPHSFLDFVRLQEWMLNFTNFWHVSGTPYGYVVLSSFTYVLPGVTSAPVYAFDLVLLAWVPLAALAYLSRTEPPKALVFWALAGLVPLFNKGFVWYLAFEVLGAALMLTWYAYAFKDKGRFMRVIPVLLLVAEVLVFVSYLPR